MGKEFLTIRSMYREIDPRKLIEKRGNRSRKLIAELAQGPTKKPLTEQDIYGYEKGLWQPSKEKLPYLLKALETTFDEVSQPVELAAN